MKHCSYCNVDVKGDWTSCPLCGHTTKDTGKRVANPYPDVPLKFSRQKVTKSMLLVSLIIIFGTFLVGLIWRGRVQGLQGALFGIMTMWLVVLIFIRKRRNLVKSILYLLVCLSLICIYFDFLAGWTAWSTTYAVPLICSFALLAMFLISRLFKMKTGDYILYFLAGGALGLVPTLFLFFDWVRNPIPAWISIGLSLSLLILIIWFRGREIIAELHKRLFI